MATIAKVWFDDKRIYIQDDHGGIHSRPLEAFPRLLEATRDQRDLYEIGLHGDDIRWESLDEDIHITSFLETPGTEPDTGNEIAAIFKRFPEINVSEMARTIGIDKSLLSRYIYGIKKPSAKRKEMILQAIRKLGREMASYPDKEYQGSANE